MSIRISVRIVDEGSNVRYPGVIVKMSGEVPTRKDAAACVSLLARALATEEKK